jgi:hypothetical protein
VGAHFALESPDRLFAHTTMARCDARFFRVLARKNGIVPSFFKRAAPTDSARAEAASETETSDTMFEAFYKTAMSVRELS